MRWVFGESELDPETFELRRGGRPIPVQRKVFELIRYLIDHRDRAITKEELFEKVWSGVHVSESALAWGVSQARKALGQSRAEATPIETLHGRGYRFRAEVVTVDPIRERRPAVPSAAPLTGVAAPDPFVGRGAVMQELHERLSNAARGTGALVLLTGDAGIGKTRCAEQLAATVPAREFRTAWGSCWEGEGAHPFWPWVPVVRACAEDETVSPAVQRDARALLEAQSSRGLASAARVEPEDEDVFWVLDALRELLRALERERPMLIVLDDLQWADDLSLRGLHLLAPELQRLRILVVATIRDRDVKPSDVAARALPRLFRHATRIALTPLSVSEVASYLELVTGDLPANGTAERLHGRTGGNPLFVRELFRRHGAGAADEVRHRRGSVDVPEAVRDVLRGSVGRCDTEVRTVLDVAGVIGDSFDIVDLGDTLTLNAEVLVSALERAVDAGILRDLPGVGQYGFVHGLLREVVYGDLPTPTRSAHHVTIATALEARPSSGWKDLPRIAYHRHAALPLGDAPKAARAAAHAAGDARRLNAHADAVQLYRWALDAERLTEPRDPRFRAELLLGLSAAARGTSAEHDARRYAEEAIEIATYHGWTDLLVVGARRLRPTFAWRRAADPTAREALERALAELPEGAPPMLRVYVLSALAGVPPYSLSARRSRDLSDRARELAKSLGGRPRLEALRSGLFSRSGPDDVDELLQITDEILQADGGKTWLSADARYARFPALTYRGDMQHADEELEAFGVLARRFRLDEAVWNFDRNRAQFFYMRGQFAAAEALWAELSVRASRGGLWYGALLLPSHLALLDRERKGTSPLASDVWTRLWDSARAAPRTRASMAMYLAEEGRHVEAQAELEAVLQGGIQGIDRDIEYLATLASLSVAAVLLEDRGRAAELHVALAPYVEFTTPDAYSFNLGSVALYLGRLDRILGRLEDARRHVAVAAERNAKLGFLPRAAESQFELAELLADTDRGAAVAHAEGAARAARNLGMDPLTERATRLAARLAR